MRKIRQITAAALLALTATTASAQVKLYGNVTNGYNTTKQVEAYGQTFNVELNWGPERVGIHQFDIAANGNTEQTMLVSNATLVAAAGNADSYGLGWYDENGTWIQAYGSNIYGRAGAVYVNGKYYTFNPSQGDNYGGADNDVYTHVWMRTWDAAAYFNDASSNPLSWKLTEPAATVYGEDYMSFTDLTYDYDDDQVYGISVIVSDESPAVPYLLTKVDMEARTATPVSTLSLPEEIRALAAHPNGYLYGIGPSGMLYQINKETAECTALGVLHKSQHRIQSAVVDWRTGKLYWTCNEYPEVQSANGVPPTAEQEFQNNVTALYEVDVEAVTEKKLLNYDYREEVAGLFFIDDYVQKDNDLSVKWLSLPQQMIVNEPAQIAVNVKNRGTKQANGFKLELYVNGEMVKTLNGSPLKAGASKEFTFTYVPEVTVGEAADVQVKLNYAKDENLDNNETNVKTITVQQADLPTVTISGTQNEGTVNLSWRKPETGEKTEDFERYAPFIIDNMGNWTMFDGDEAYMPSWRSQNGTYSWPNCNAPQAFIVFNPAEAGLPADYIDQPTSTYYCNSGNQMLMAQIGGFPAQNEGGQPTLVDGNNWLISPELTGEAQEVSFFAKSWCSQVEDQFGVLYNSEEQFNVLYSLTDNNPESFQMLEDGEGLVAPAYFADGEYYFELPEGAKYFAIQHVTPWIADEYGEYNRMTAFFLDDITYTPAVPGIVGYNIYRNGSKLNAEPVTNLRYSLQLVHGMNEIYVTVVYENGESAPSNPFVVEFTGQGATAINAVAVDAARMSVYTMAGQYVGNRLPAEKGTYVVRTNGKTQKVVVK